MPLDRSTIIIGPGKIAHDGATYFSDADIILNLTKEFFEVKVDAFGTVLRALTDVSIEVTATPKEWANHAKMNPFLAMAIGTSLLGGTDKPLVITPINGQPVTLAAAGVMKPPSLICSANKAPLGSMTWTGVIANNTAWSATGARISHGSTASGVALTGFVKANAGLCTWEPVFGETTLKTEDGTTIDWQVQLDPQRTDSDGVVDYSFGGIEATAKLTPVGLTAEDYVALLGLQGSGITRGASSAMADLVITGGGGLSRSVTLKNCTPRVGAQRFGRATKRLGELEFVASRDHTTGTLNAIATIA